MHLDPQNDEAKEEGRKLQGIIENFMNPVSKAPRLIEGQVCSSPVPRFSSIVLPKPRFSRSPYLAASIGIQNSSLRPFPPLFVTNTCFSTFNEAQQDLSITLEDLTMTLEDLRMTLEELRKNR